MKDVNIFIPEPGNTRAILAVSALARAMKEANKVAIVRCVWRQGQGNVAVGVLTPNISDRENIVSLQDLKYAEGFVFSWKLVHLSTVSFSFQGFVFTVDLMCFLVIRMNSLIHFTSTCFLLLRMSENFSSLLSAISQIRGCQLNNNKRQRITSYGCLILHLLEKRKLCCLTLHQILCWRYSSVRSSFGTDLFSRVSWFLHSFL